MADTPVSSRTFNANSLRALAEAADSIRNEEVWIVENPDPSKGGPYIVVKKADGERQSARPCIKLQTDDENADVVRDPLNLESKPPLKFKNGEKVDFNKCDAIFTTLPAIEKFVVPYYAGMRTLDECSEMRGKFAHDENVLAMVHLPSSVVDTGEPDELYVATKSDDGTRTLEPLQVFLSR